MNNDAVWQIFVVPGLLFYAALYFLGKTGRARVVGVVVILALIFAYLVLVFSANWS